MRHHLPAKTENSLCVAPTIKNSNKTKETAEHNLPIISKDDNNVVLIISRAALFGIKILEHAQCNT